MRWDRLIALINSYDLPRLWLHSLFHDGPRHGNVHARNAVLAFYIPEIPVVL